MGWFWMPPKQKDEPKMDQPAPDPVLGWRFSQLIALGLDLDRAEAASKNHDFVLAKFRQLLDTGCDRVTAYEICM